MRSATILVVGLVVGLIVVIAAGLIAILASRRGGGSPPEPRNVEELDEPRLRELIRGTSLHLRDMRYRYSVRMPRGTGGEGAIEEGFSADVNEIRLGFVPAVITDNRTDEQDYGYVAFVHDGHRWRGPGLPCPPGREAALRHAERCVTPEEEESDQ